MYRADDPDRNLWFWHAFHESLLSQLGMTEAERREEIETQKPVGERARRLRMFQPAQVPPELVEWLSANAGYYGQPKRTVGRATRYPKWEQVLTALHDEQCVKKQGELGCPWKEDRVWSTLFPELEEAGISVGYTWEPGDYSGPELV